MVRLNRGDTRLGFALAKRAMSNRDTSVSSAKLNGGSVTTATRPASD